jgi:tetratricopeptide (TPR) repeat protein
MMGRFDEAMGRFREAEKLARRFKDYRVIVLALMNSGLCLQYGNRALDEAQFAFRAARKIAKKRILRPNLVTIAVNEAQLLFDMEQYGRALSVIKEGLEIAKQFGYRQPYVGMLSNLALYQCILGKWDESRQSAASALRLAGHHAMTYWCGVNHHTLGMLAGQSGDIDECIADQSASTRDHIEANYPDSARAALSEILIVANQWGVPGLVRGHLEEHPALLEGLSEQSGNVHALSLRAQVAVHGVLSGNSPVHLAERELRDCLQAAVSQGTLGPQAEIGEALVAYFSLQERFEEACDTGETLMSALARHHYPLKVPPFLLTLAAAQERAGRWEALKPVIRALRRYEKTLDRGLTGMHYHALMSRAAQRAGRKKVAREHRARAVQIAQTVLALQKSPPYREAFLALPEVRELLGSPD